jgi:hypothetical protein
MATKEKKPIHKVQMTEGVGGGQNSHSKGGEKRPILGKLRTNNSVHFNLLSIRFV